MTQLRIDCEMSDDLVNAEAIDTVLRRLAALERVAAAAVAYESSASSYEGASRLDESFAKSNLFAALAALRESEGDG